jgi:hypothetical protein
MAVLEVEELQQIFANMLAPAPAGADGYVDRVRLVEDVEDVRSCFEFGGHYGCGLITWLWAFPEITWAGWCDNQTAFAGSNATCEANVRGFLGERPCQLWYTESAIEAVGIRADLVMVDGDHSAEGAMIDLTLAFAMQPKVVLCDDMNMETVRHGVEAFRYYTGRRYKEYGAAAGTAIFRRDSARRKVRSRSV